MQVRHHGEQRVKLAEEVDLSLSTSSRMVTWRRSEGDQENAVSKPAGSEAAYGWSPSPGFAMCRKWMR